MIFGLQQQNYNFREGLTHLTFHITKPQLAHNYRYVQLVFWGKHQFALAVSELLTRPPKIGLMDKSDANFR